jgi:ankyrin repeat protein
MMMMYLRTTSVIFLALQLPLGSAEDKIEYGVDTTPDQVPEGGVTDMHHSVVAQDYEMVEHNLEHDPRMVHAKDSNGWTPLHEAVVRQSQDIVNLLVHEGDADVNEFTNDGITVLGLAIEIHGVDHPMVELLLSFEAITEAHAFVAAQYYDMLEDCLERQPLLASFKDFNGWTPLHQAVILPSEAIVRLLIEEGSGKCFSTGF